MDASSIHFFWNGTCTRLLRMLMQSRLLQTKTCKTKTQNSEAKKLPTVQLYDLSNDIAETKNLQDEHPEVVKRLTALLEGYVDRGRSTPGKAQQNNGKVNIFIK